ncbi:MAG: 50S ribosomal protein L10 [bacterium]
MGNAKVVDRKKKVVEALQEKIDSASIIVLTDYRGISVKQVTEFRKALYKNDSEYKVVKNTLLRRAMEAAGHAELNEHIVGPTALLLGYKDPVEPVKALVDFVAEIEKGEIKAGLMEKKIVDSKGIESISKLPSREELIAKMVSGFNAPLYGLVNVLAGSMRKLVYALNAVKDKKAQEPASAVAAVEVSAPVVEEPKAEEVKVEEPINESEGGEK